MRKFATLFLLLQIGLCAQAQNTYYYKLIKKVKNGVTNTNVSGGQFITVADNVCYESDNKGFSVKHGRLDYKYSNNGIRAYVGGSYWGNHAVFLFKDDFSALNVKTEEGDVYVYKQACAPTGATTCSFIRKESNNGNSNSLPVCVDHPSMAINDNSEDNQGFKIVVVNEKCINCTGGYIYTKYYAGNGRINTHKRRCGFCNGKGTVRERVIK